MSENQQVIEVNMNTFKSVIDNPPVIVKITKSDENLSEFEELMKLQEETKFLLAEGKKCIAKVIAKENLLKKIKSDYEKQEQGYANEQNFYRGQWSECRQKFDDLKVVINNLKNRIREEEQHRETEVVEENGDVIRLYQENCEE